MWAFPFGAGPGAVRRRPDRVRARRRVARGDRPARRAGGRGRAAAGRLQLVRVLPGARRVVAAGRRIGRRSALAFAALRDPGCAARRLLGVRRRAAGLHASACSRSARSTCAGCCPACGWARSRCARRVPVALASAPVLALRLALWGGERTLAQALLELALWLGGARARDASASRAGCSPSCAATCARARRREARAALARGRGHLRLHAAPLPRAAGRGHPDAGRDPDGRRAVAVARLRLGLRPGRAARRDGARASSSGRRCCGGGCCASPPTRPPRCSSTRWSATQRPALGARAWAAAAVTAAQPTSANPTAPALALRARARSCSRPAAARAGPARPRPPPRSGAPTWARSPRSPPRRRCCWPERGAPDRRARRCAIRSGAAPKRRVRRRGGPVRMRRSSACSSPRSACVVLYAPFVIAAGPGARVGRARRPGHARRGVVAAAVPRAGSAVATSKDFLDLAGAVRGAGHARPRAPSAFRRTVGLLDPRRRRGGLLRLARRSRARAGRCWSSPRRSRRWSGRSSPARRCSRCCSSSGTANRASALLRPPDLEPFGERPRPAGGGARRCRASSRSSSSSCRPGSRSTSRRDGRTSSPSRTRSCTT